MAGASVTLFSEAVHSHRRPSGGWRTGGAHSHKLPPVDSRFYKVPEPRRSPRGRNSRGPPGGSERGPSPSRSVVPVVRPDESLRGVVRGPILPELAVRGGRSEGPPRYGPVSGTDHVSLGEQRGNGPTWGSSHGRIKTSPLKSLPLLTFPPVLPPGAQSGSSRVGVVQKRLVTETLRPDHRDVGSYPDTLTTPEPSRSHASGGRAAGTHVRQSTPWSVSVPEHKDRSITEQERILLGLTNKSSVDSDN